jgi:hypothetical protein
MFPPGNSFKTGTRSFTPLLGGGNKFSPNSQIVKRYSRIALLEFVATVTQTSAFQLIIDITIYDISYRKIFSQDIR